MTDPAPFLKNSASSFLKKQSLTFITDEEASSFFEESPSLELLTPGLGGDLSLDSQEWHSSALTNTLCLIFNVTYNLNFLSDVS